MEDFKITCTDTTTEGFVPHWDYYSLKQLVLIIKRADEKLNYHKLKYRINDYVVTWGNNSNFDDDFVSLNGCYRYNLLPHENYQYETRDLI